MTTPDAWDAVEPQRAGVPVLCLGAWEGPLDQLLDLARREKVDLARLSIAEMAEQFNRLCLAALAGQQVPLSRGADWLVMASWLALLRAQLFLPPDARAARPDPTADRERALWLADWLERRPQLGLDVLACGDPEPRQRTNGDADLLDLFRVCFELLALPAGEGVYRPKPATLWRVPAAIEHVRGALRQASEGARLADLLPRTP
jgi:segregation and condensation protein A